MAGIPDDDAARLPPHPVLTAHYRSEHERRRFLDDLFDTTAPRYDRITSVMSLGSGAWHRRQALLRAGLGRGMTILDVAVGTGAVAREAKGIVGQTGRVIGIDPSVGMLSETRRALRIAVVRGLAERLPFREGAFDFVSMGYALRHVSDLRRTFWEYHRVLRPGGTLVILDFTHPHTWLGSALARLYFGAIVPWAARVSGGSRHARLLMRYCWASVRHSVSAQAICRAIVDAGFDPPRGKTDFGVFIEYSAVKPTVGAGVAVRVTSLGDGTLSDH